MKTVLDAVIEFKGKWPFSTGFMCMPSGDNDVATRGRMKPADSKYTNEYWVNVCSRNEFNALVDELASNFGECDISYQKHCSNEVTRLEGNEMKTSKYTYIGKSSKFFTNGECYDISEARNGYITKDNCYEEHGLIEDFLSDNFMLFTSKPVYTQEQAVLMEESLKCIIDHLSEYGTCGVNSNVKNGYDAPNIDSFKEPQQRAKWVAKNALGLLNLEPPVELKEKSLYLFTVGRKVDMVGEAYFTAIDEEPMLTNIRTNTSYSQDCCTNIKPLTVD